MFVRPGLYVLKKTNMPATLVEIGFISNPGEAAVMREKSRNHPMLSRNLL
jgi:N-acetylmuramoyl-L-alanine amidase